MAPPYDPYAEKGLLSPESSQQTSFEETDRRHDTIRISRRHSLLYAACCMLIGMIVSLVTLSISSSIYLQSLQPISLDTGLDPALRPGEEPVENGYWCGTTPEEARARGCKFDVILYSWVPPLCYDAELQQAYLDQRESEWYLERGGGSGARVSQERASTGEEPGLWLPWAYHDYHCQFIWKMMTRILRNSSMGIPGRLLEYYHTDHCINVLKGIERQPTVDVSTLVALNYSTCYSRV